MNDASSTPRPALRLGQRVLVTVRADAPPQPGTVHGLGPCRRYPGADDVAVALDGELTISGVPRVDVWPRDRVEAYAAEAA